MRDREFKLKDLGHLDGGNLGEIALARIKGREPLGSKEGRMNIWRQLQWLRRYTPGYYENFVDLTPPDEGSKV